MDKMLSCAAAELSAQCTEQALRHVSKMVSIWARKFDRNCTLSDFGIAKEVKPVVELVLDATPKQLTVDETAVPSSATTAPRASFIITASIIPEPEPEPEPNTESSQLSTSSPTQVAMTGDLPQPEPEPTPSPEPEPLPHSSVEPSSSSSWTEDSPSTVPEPADAQSFVGSNLPSTPPVPEPSPEPGQQTVNGTTTDSKWRTQEYEFFTL
ncbi:unnamed protein product [Gongylonema pulchrum]|uniref:CID domain-containing protein n=1 Tax=Gongylonema pulchrum TaxID=637853 RepID=A0A183DIT5_9BILA|nr:unnamed protein product [Gongylonema pulchrum]